MSGELKAIYLARRNPSLSRAEFPARWRRHGALAMSLPFWQHASGYFHNDVLADPPADADTQLSEMWSSDYDGVGVVYLASSADMEGLIQHPTFPLLHADEWGAFDQQVEHFSVFTTEEAHKSQRGAAIKSFAFLRPRPGIGREEFDARWLRHVGLVMRSEQLSRLVLTYMHNHPLPMDAAGDSERAVQGRLELGFGDVWGVTELGFASRGDMEAYLRHPARDGIREDLEHFVDLGRTVLVATNEVTMDARRSAAR